jgi:hypothetical protein
LKRYRYFSTARLNALRFFHDKKRDPCQFPSKKMIGQMLREGQILRQSTGPKFLEQIVLSEKGYADLIAKREQRYA